MALWNGASAVAACGDMTELLAPDGAMLDWFGQAVAVDGEIAVVGAPGNNSAYVFRRGDAAWELEQQLWGSGMFGKSVSVSGDVVVIGAFTNATNGPSAGSAFVYRHNGAEWVLEQQLLASDGESGDYFGSAVSISDDTIIVGAWNEYDPYEWELGYGAAYIFRYGGSTWDEEAKLVASDGEQADWFGISVGISGNTAVVGAHGDDDNGPQAGAAYVFNFDGNGWIESQKLLTADGASSDLLGEASAISGDVILLGARGDDDLGSKSGAAYTFRRQGGQWIEEAKILASDGAALDEFGIAVALDGNVAVIGSHLDDDNGTASGSAYVFRFDAEGQQWQEDRKLLSMDGGIAEYFGVAVAVAGDTIIAGSNRDAQNGPDSGSACIFDNSCVVESENPYDLTGDGIVGSADLNLLLGSWGPNPDDPADYNGDDVVDYFDLAIMLGAWGA